MFLHLSVILFTGGGCLPQCMLGYHPPTEADTPPHGRHPLEADTPPRSRSLPPWKQTPPQKQTPPLHSSACWKIWSKILSKKECIPLGCIPPAWWPYPVVSHASQGDLHPGEGICIQGGLPPEGGLPPGGFGQTPPPDADPLIMWSGMHAGKPTPLPCGQTNTCENITLPKLRLRAVINFMA